MSQSPAPQTDVNRLVRQEMMLEQLKPIEEIIDAARKEVAKHRADCAAAETQGSVDPQRLYEGRAAAEGVDELLARFESMADEVSGHSKVGDAALETMHARLEKLRAQMAGVVERLDALS
jgi:hypothetical protein